MVRVLALACLLLLIGGCDRRRDAGAVVVSAPGAARLIDFGRVPTDPAARLFTDATAQGLVRFDAAGGIEPGLAERWIVTDEGTSYIFRLREANWSDGSPVTAAQIVSILRRRVSAGERNPLKPFLTAIDEIVEMTPEVIEVRLLRPRPDLLKLFAQPELALVRLARPSGSGPFRDAPSARSAVLLRPVPDRNRDPDAQAPDARDDVRLVGERTAKGLARFAAGRSDMVTGGTFADYPLVAAAAIAPANQRLDPAVGLFGLAIAERTGFLADPAGRSAIAAAFNRPALAAAFTSDWQVADQILPDQLDSAALPARGDWAALSTDDRLAAAQTRVAAWLTAQGPITLRIALPDGPGATVLFGSLARDLRQIGIASIRVPVDAAADLRLVDAVAPYDSARWYLATACQPCSPEAEAALVAARDAPSLAERGRRIAEADAALAADGAFIPLARPLRWSVVALRLRAWQPNARAWHPLNRLRGTPN
ncbi:ABC transporter substrate-binding protein [Sphingomonas aracearum]|uniref:ABC transporter substrate-binding protein n=1 Tax=Sphingomonas aracearum TaxID=2283317 RepID=A0A369VSA1_9SPHN|nr:ABC transporter substrate-binding protein [Sphingomonas aracearum]RDE05266.1 ABC transporter substrate-binding protein [Sphingomonas aracearum]